MTGLLDNIIQTFFQDGAAFEIACEHKDTFEMTCNADMKSFKGYLHRWLAVSAQLAPFAKTKIMDVLKKSTAAAVSQCTGGANGRTCGFHWQARQYDGTVGAGQQMNVLGALTSLLIDQVQAPFTAANGGTSQGDFNAGGGDGMELYMHPISTGDRAGAGILTAFILIGALGTFAWMSTQFFEGAT